MTYAIIAVILAHALLIGAAWWRQRAAETVAIPPVPEHVRTIEYYHATGELYRVGAEHIVTFEHFLPEHWPEFVPKCVNVCRCDEAGSVADFRPVILGFAGQGCSEAAERYAMSFWGSGS